MGIGWREHIDEASMCLQVVDGKKCDEFLWEFNPVSATMNM